MNKSRKIRLLVFVILIIFISQAGFLAYSVIYQGGTLLTPETQTAADAGSTPVPTEPSSATPAPSPVPQQSDVIVISDEILEFIRLSDPQNYDKNITNYKNLLIKLDVHEKFKNEIERLVKAGYRIPDLLIAYEFLYENYGRLEQLEALAGEHKSGKGWDRVFKDYMSDNPEFVPGNFDSDYLDSLMKIPSITTDDMMIADRVSQKASVQVKEVMDKRIDGFSWKDINAEFNIVNTQSAMPHMQITREKINKYTQSGKLSEQVVVDALVIADKLGKTGDEIIDKILGGDTPEDIFAWGYEEKYY